jgi:hypothetical protein
MSEPLENQPTNEIGQAAVNTCHRAFDPELIASLFWSGRPDATRPYAIHLEGGIQ